MDSAKEIKIPLTRLIGRLKRAQFDLSVAVMLGIQKILADPQSLGIYAIEDLRFILGPLICRNMDEQDKFYRIFDEFLKEDILPPLGKDPGGPTRQEQAGRQIVKRIIWLFSVLVLLLILLFPVKKTNDTSGRQIQFTINYPQQVFVGQQFSMNALLEDTIASHSYTVQWRIGDSTYPAAHNIAHSFDHPGTYPVKGTLLDGNHALLTSSGTINATCDLVPKVYLTANDTATTPVKTYYASIINGSASLRCQFSWHLNDSDLHCHKDSLQLSSLTTPSPYIVRVTAACSGNGCLTNTTSSDSLTQNPRLTLSVMPQPGLIPLAIRPRWGNIFLWGLLFFVPSGAFVYFRFYNRWKPAFGKKPSPSPYKKPYKISFPDEISLPSSDMGVRQLADVLRKRQFSDTFRLDAILSIRQTIRAGGFPSLCFTPGTKPKNFLLLLDKEYPDSHLVNLFTNLASLLKAQQVNLITYTYYKEPLFLDNQPLNHRHLPIDKLANLYPNSILFLLSDAAALFYPNTLQLKENILGKLNRWETRFIFTPVSQVDWSSKEHSLHEAGLSVVAADLNTSPGSGYSARFLDMQHWPDLAGYIAQAVRQLHKQYDYPEDPELLQQWLCALGIYPRSNWQFTLAIGKALEEKFQSEDRCRPQELLNYSNLLVLARIPWMRTGQCNDSLRLELLRHLTKDNEILARKVLEKMLTGFAAQHKVTERSLVNSELELMRTTNRFLLHLHDPTSFRLTRQERRKMRYYLEEQLIDWVTERHYNDPDNPTVDTTLQQQFPLAYARPRRFAATAVFLSIFLLQVLLLGLFDRRRLFVDSLDQLTFFVLKNGPASKIKVINDPVIRVNGKPYIFPFINDTAKVFGLPNDTSVSCIIELDIESETSGNQQSLAAGFIPGHKVYFVVPRMESYLPPPPSRPPPASSAAVHTRATKKRLPSQHTTPPLSTGGDSLASLRARQTANLDSTVPTPDTPQYQRGQTNPVRSTGDTTRLLPATSTDIKSLYLAYAGKIIRHIYVRSYGPTPPNYDYTDTLHPKLLPKYTDKQRQRFERSIKNKLTVKEGKPIIADQILSDENRVKSMSTVVDARLLITVLPDNPDSVDLVLVAMKKYK